jgi:hypothetical protein
MLQRRITTRVVRRNDDQRAQESSEEDDEELDRQLKQIQVQNTQEFLTSLEDLSYT